MRLSRAFLFVTSLLFVVTGVLFALIRYNASPPAPSPEVEALDRIIMEKEAALEALSQRSPEEEARIAAEREILSATMVEGDTTVPGVRIEITLKEKVIINEREGYRITLPLQLVLARSIESNHLEFHDPETMCKGDPSCPPVLRIDVAGENLTHLPLADWLSAAEAAAGELIYSPRESVATRGFSVVKVTTLLPEIFDGYDYYFAHGEKIYVLQVSRVADALYQEAISSLALVSP